MRDNTHISSKTMFAIAFLAASLNLAIVPIRTVADEKSVRPPAPLAEGQNGVIVGTTGAAAVHAGLETLKAGGSAADAAMATALAQVVECCGAYVSHAGILSMTYYDAQTGQVHFLNACYNTPLEEKDPLSIPPMGTPSGRTTLVPGFMAGVHAAHERFGKLPRAKVFEPAIRMAEDGIRIGPPLAGMINAKKDVLSRLLETKRIFTKDDGSYYGSGDLFLQPALATTLRRLSSEGADFMYSGEWAQKFVSAVQAQGGKISLDDMRAYKVIWESPLRTDFREYEVCAPGFSSQGGVTIVEALHLMERADLRKLGHYSTSAESLFWLMQISHCILLEFVPPETASLLAGTDMSAESRVKPETADWIWQQMQAGKWPSVSKPVKPGGEPPKHSDGVVAVDRWGNVAAVTHSINTVLWGSTGIFVDGISIPDSATFQQSAIKQAGPGHRLPDPMCPLIVLSAGRPVLGSSAIGAGLHQRTIQALASVLEHGMSAQAAADAPAFLFPDFAGAKPVERVEQGKFDSRLLEAINGLGQKTIAVGPREAVAYRGYWIGVQIDRESGSRTGAGTRDLPSYAEGY